MSLVTDVPSIVLIPVRAPGRRAAPRASRERLRQLPAVLGASADPVCSPARVPLVPVVRSQPLPMRLTRRGRGALCAVAVVLGACLLFVSHLSLGASAGTPSPAGAGVVTVGPGDTLWSIASRIAPGDDPRAVVAALRVVNHLTGAAITPGQRLAVN
jgi:Tfp pilus assembly protein FimV